MVYIRTEHHSKVYIVSERKGRVTNGNTTGTILSRGQAEVARFSEREAPLKKQQPKVHGWSLYDLMEHQVDSGAVVAPSKLDGLVEIGLMSGLRRAPGRFVAHDPTCYRVPNRRASGPSWGGKSVV